MFSIAQRYYILLDLQDLKQPRAFNSFFFFFFKWNHQNRSNPSLWKTKDFTTGMQPCPSFVGQHLDPGLPKAARYVGSSVFGIAHAVSIDGKHGLSLWQARGVVDFADPRLASAFPQVQTANSTSCTNSDVSSVMPYPHVLKTPLTGW